MKISVIIAAGGQGLRANLNRNKLLREIDGVSALERSIAAFPPYADEIVVSAAETDFDEISLISRKYGALTVKGGETRFDSVQRALEHCTGEIVLIHDGARPFVTDECIRNCIESVKTCGSGICAVPVGDTVARTEGESIDGYPDRDTLRLLQTPQGFYLDKLREAYRKAKKDERDFTDDSGVYRAYVEPPRLCPGSKKNIKLTYPEDFVRDFVSGIGTDTHAYGEGEGIVLGGVPVPCDFGVIAHSDGDVLLHAVMDAMLSGAGLKDIGHYFPDTDPRYRGISSLVLLDSVVRLLADEGWRVRNVSAAIRAQKPKISPYAEKIRASLSNALNLPLSAVGLSATTDEGIGFIGRGEGMNVVATVSLLPIR